MLPRWCEILWNPSTENTVSSWINHPDPPPRMITESMCWSAAACRHTVLLYPPLTLKALLSLPLTTQLFLSLVYIRRLGEWRGVSVVLLLCSVLIRSKRRMQWCCVSVVSSRFNLGHACRLGARRWLLVSIVGSCGCVCVCDLFISIFLSLFLSPESMWKNTNNNNNSICCHISTRSSASFSVLTLNCRRSLVSDHFTWRHNEISIRPQLCEHFVFHCFIPPLLP